MVQEGARLIDGSAAREEGARRGRDDVAALRARGVMPGLTVVLVGDDPASAVYVGGKEKASREAGMAGETIRLPATTTQAELLALVDQLNARRQPCTASSCRCRCRSRSIPTRSSDRIRPEKDVDGFHPVNVGKLLDRRHAMASCRARRPACCVMLGEYGVRDRGRATASSSGAATSSASRWRR